MPRVKKQSPIISILIMILGIMAGFFVNSQVTSELIDEDLTALITAQKVEFEFTTFNDIDFNVKIFDRADYRSLKIFGPEQLNSAGSGRSNIFAPF